MARPRHPPAPGSLRAMVRQRMAEPQDANAERAVDVLVLLDEAVREKERKRPFIAREHVTDGNRETECARPGFGVLKQPAADTSSRGRT
jgi:hypothetical protein